MQVAIAGVEDVANGQRILFADFFDLAQSFGNARPRYHAILHVKRRRDASNGAERVLAARPQQRALLRVFGNANFARVLPQANFADGLHLIVHRFLHSFHFNEQHRARIERIAGVRRGFHGAQRPAIQQFQRGGGDAFAGNSHHRVRSVFNLIEYGQHGRGSFGKRHELHRNFRRDAERSL